MLFEVWIKGYEDLDSKEPLEFDEVKGRYRYITLGCVERAINHAKRLTAGKETVYYEASAAIQTIADGINKTPMTHHQAIIMVQLREPGKGLFNVIFDTQPMRRSSDGT